MEVSKLPQPDVRATLRATRPTFMEHQVERVVEEGKEGSSGSKLSLLITLHMQ